MCVGRPPSGLPWAAMLAPHRVHSMTVAGERGFSEPIALGGGGRPSQTRACAEGRACCLSWWFMNGRRAGIYAVVLVTRGDGVLLLLPPQPLHPLVVPRPLGCCCWAAEFVFCSRVVWPLATLNGCSGGGTACSSGDLIRDSLVLPMDMLPVDMQSLDGVSTRLAAETGKCV